VARLSGILGYCRGRKTAPHRSPEVPNERDSDSLACIGESLLLVRFSLPSNRKCPANNSMNQYPSRSRILVALLLLLSAVVARSHGDEAADQVDVYLLAGQSNMQGNAKLADLPAAWRAPIDGCLFYEGGKFVALEPGKTRTSSRPDEFGPEIGFARALCSLKPEKPIYIIKFHRSGQPLHHGWNGNRWVGAAPAPGRANFYPGEAASDPNIGSHYRAMIATAQAAFTVLREAGKEPALRAIVWMQGEQDSKMEESASTYAASISRLKRRTEEDLAAPPVPFVLGQVLPHAPALERFTHRVEIREQQRRVDMRSGAAEATAGCWMVSTDGMPLQADTVHYDALGQALLGQSFALGVLQAREVLKTSENRKE
jgi:hypothetical protein